MPVLPLQMNVDLAQQHDRAEVLRRLAAYMRAIDRSSDAEELEQAAAVLPLLELAYMRLSHFQELCFNPPRTMTRKQWRDTEWQARDAQQGVDWLHNHWYLPNDDNLLVRSAVVLLQTAGRGEKPDRLVRGAGMALDHISSHCAAIALAEGDPLDDMHWEGEAAEPRARIARAAVGRLVQASRIRGYDDAEEQARIGLVKEAQNLTLRTAA
ncbi:hypothetical protein [Streptomyces parvus]|uniref:hypothetical protein n=1 Tax=Streptomyces parvus TaxID=66428 RepID=UPI003D726374